MPKQTLSQTTVRLSGEDRDLIAYIQERNGLRSATSVIRFVIRKVARQLQAEDRRAARPQPGEGEGCK